MDNKFPPIIAVDFDGTLCDSKYPELGPPIERTFGYLKWRRETAGAKIILWTCRSGKELDDAVKWCSDHGLIFDSVNENLPEVLDAYGYYDSRKITADEYIDDKNVFI